MQKIHKLCLFFVLFNLVGCSSSWPDDLKGTSFEPVNKTMQPQGEHKKGPISNKTFLTKIGI